MNFNENKAIYLQIADFVFEQILTQKWNKGERAMSVRELGVVLEVNPNTVLRSYDFLQSMEIIINRRGVGYFVAEDAEEKIIHYRKQIFINEELPTIFKNMQLLQIQLEDLKPLYDHYLSTQNNN